MPEIWSLSLTHEGIGACALSLDASHRLYSERWSFVRKYGLWCVEMAELRKAVARAIRALWADSDIPPTAIALSTPQSMTAVFADRQGPASPVFFDAPLTIPRRDIPKDYGDTPELGKAYRNSVLRRLQQFYPELGLNTPLGIHSLGAAVMRVLTGHSADACIPLGVPSQYPGFSKETRAMFFQAMGYHPDFSSQRVFAGKRVACITPELAANLSVENAPEFSRLAGIPVYCLGNSDGARSYASASNPLSWSVQAGTQIRAHWTAGCNALAAFEIQIIPKTPDTDNAPDAQTPDNQNNASQPDDPSELTADEWTRLFNDSLRLEVSPGPQKALATYGLSLPGFDSPFILDPIRALTDPHSGRILFKTLSHAPLGSGGLHLLHNASGWQLIGLTSAHENAHLVRACFEGLMYSVRSWRENLNQKGLGPIRLVLSPPWPAECAQWAADIMQSALIYIDETSENLAAFGAALALMRDLKLEMTAKPHIPAQIVEPSERSAYYQLHYQVHQQLENRL